MCNKRLGKLLGVAVCISMMTGCGASTEVTESEVVEEVVNESTEEATEVPAIEETEVAVETTEEPASDGITVEAETTFVEEPSFSYYADTYLETCKVGTFHMDENGKMLIRQGEFGTNEEGSNSVMLYIEGAEELTYELTDDVYINVFYPIDYVNGTQITGEEFLNYLKDYSIDCYYHLTDDGRIDAILGEYYA